MSLCPANTALSPRLRGSSQKPDWQSELYSHNWISVRSYGIEVLWLVKVFFCALAKLKPFFLLI